MTNNKYILIIIFLHLSLFSTARSQRVEIPLELNTFSFSLWFNKIHDDKVYDITDGEIQKNKTTTKINFEVTNKKDRSYVANKTASGIIGTFDYQTISLTKLKSILNNRMSSLSDLTKNIKGFKTVQLEKGLKITWQICFRDSNGNPQPMYLITYFNPPQGKENQIKLQASYIFLGEVKEVKAK